MPEGYSTIDLYLPGESYNQRVCEAMMLFEVSYSLFLWTPTREGYGINGLRTGYDFRKLAGSKSITAMFFTETVPDYVVPESDKLVLRSVVQAGSVVVSARGRREAIKSSAELLTDPSLELRLREIQEEAWRHRVAVTQSQLECFRALDGIARALRSIMEEAGYSANQADLLIHDLIDAIMRPLREAASEGLRPVQIEDEAG